MTKVIHCPCGTVLRSTDVDDLVRLARDHAQEAHDMDLTSEQALAMARPE